MLMHLFIYLYNEYIKYESFSIFISKIFQGPPMNIKLESEPLEVECNPFNFSSGAATGKKRRKKKDKEKKVKN